MSASAEISSTDLRRQLYNALRSNGVVENLKTNLRAQMLNQIQQKDGKVLDVKAQQLTVWHRILNSVIADYLRACKYEYTLSIFLPECGLHSSQQMSKEEILQLLNIKADSTLHRAIGHGSEEAAVAVGLFKGIADIQLQLQGVDTQTQTEETGSYVLSAQLQQVDDVYNHAIEIEKIAPYRAMEERMAKYRRECDERGRAEVKAQVERVREFEVGQARMEEAARYRRMLQSAREELERVHEERLAKLRTREEAHQERIRRQEKALEAAAYEHRQKLLKESEAVTKRREEVGKRELALDAERQQSDERLRAREAQVGEREAELGRVQAAAVADAERAVIARRREVEREHEAVLREGAADRHRLEQDIAAFREERAAAAAADAGLAAERAFAEQLKHELALERQQTAAKEALVTEMGHQLEATNQQLAHSRQELEKHLYGVAITEDGDAVDPVNLNLAPPAGHASLTKVLERTRAEVAAGRKEIARLNEANRQLRREVKHWPRERSDLLNHINIWKAAAAKAEEQLEEATEGFEGCKAELEEMRIQVAAARREAEEQKVAHARTRRLLQAPPPPAAVPAFHLRSPAASTSTLDPASPLPAPPGADVSFRASPGPRSSREGQATALGATMSRLRELEAEEERLAAQLSLSRRKRTTSTQQHTLKLFERLQSDVHRAQSAPSPARSLAATNDSLYNSKYDSKFDTSDDETDVSDSVTPVRARYASRGAPRGSPEPPNLVRALVDGKEVYIPAASVAFAGGGVRDSASGLSTQEPLTPKGEGGMARTVSIGHGAGNVRYAEVMESRDTLGDSLHSPLPRSRGNEGKKEEDDERRRVEERERRREEEDREAEARRLKRLEEDRQFEEERLQRQQREEADGEEERRREQKRREEEEEEERLRKESRRRQEEEEEEQLRKERRRREEEQEEDDRRKAKRRQEEEEEEKRRQERRRRDEEEEERQRAARKQREEEEEERQRAARKQREDEEAGVRQRDEERRVREQEMEDEARRKREEEEERKREEDRARQLRENEDKMARVQREQEEEARRKRQEEDERAERTRRAEELAAKLRAQEEEERQQRRAAADAEKNKQDEERRRQEEQIAEERRRQKEEEQRRQEEEAAEERKRQAAEEEERRKRAEEEAARAQQAERAAALARSLMIDDLTGGPTPEASPQPGGLTAEESGANVVSIDSIPEIDVSTEQAIDYDDGQDVDVDYDDIMSLGGSLSGAEVNESVMSGGGGKSSGEDSVF